VGDSSRSGKRDRNNEITETRNTKRNSSFGRTAEIEKTNNIMNDKTELVGQAEKRNPSQLLF
jgi:hypothetical protein